VAFFCFLGGTAWDGAYESRLNKGNGGLFLRKYRGIFRGFLGITFGAPTIVMKLHIQNLGAVKDATIDLSKKLTVFCGPNGTGKTYAAYIVYAVTNLSGKGLSYSDANPDWWGLFETGEDIKQITASQVYRFRNQELKRVRDDANTFFSVSQNNGTDFFADFQLDGGDSEESFAEAYHQKQIIARISYNEITADIEKKAGSNEVRVKTRKQDMTNLDYNGFVHHYLYGQILAKLAFHPITAATILPVERNSILTFSKELSLRRQDLVDQMHALISSEKDNRSLVDFFFQRSARYPEPIRRALLVAEDLDAISKRKSSYSKFATSLEQDVLEGEVIIGSNGEVQFSPNRAKDKLLSIYLSSSSVKNISSLIVYLKYQAQENDLIIIDEPELNLHPDNQILLARVFSRMINAGLRLLISTHSDYIIRELNNLIMLSSEEPALRKIAKQYHYAEDEKISKDDIGVYLFNFKEGSDGVVVEPVEVAENGFEIATIEQTIKQLNEVSEEIYYTMKYGEQVRNE